VDFSQQIKNELENWTDEKLKIWNNTSWTHAILDAAGWGPFGEKPGTEGAWIPSVEDRKNAALLLKKALSSVKEIAVRDGRAQLEAMGIPSEDIDARLRVATTNDMLASFAAQLMDPESPLSLTTPDDYSRETFACYITAGKAVAAWEKNPTGALSEEELKEICSARTREVERQGKNRIAAFEDKPIEFPGDLEKAKTQFENQAKYLEDLKQAIFTTKGLSEQGIRCGFLGCENPPTVACPHGCRNWYCADCSKDHKHVLDADGKSVQAPLPRESN
jgi:hypothetical protein